MENISASSQMIRSIFSLQVLPLSGFIFIVFMVKHLGL